MDLEAAPGPRSRANEWRFARCNAPLALDIGGMPAMDLVVAAALIARCGSVTRPSFCPTYFVGAYQLYWWGKKKKKGDQ